jgi:S1-C subfamily serine protease
VPDDDDIEIEVEPEEPTRPSWLLHEPTWNDEPRIADDTERVPLAPEVGTDPAWAPGPGTGPTVLTSPASDPVAADRAATRRAALMGAIAGAVVAALVAGGIALVDDDGDSGGNGTPSALTSSARPPVDVRNGEGLDVHAVLAAVQDAVVAINIEGVGQFGSVVRAAGSGMVIDSTGLVLTNNHVVEGATSITVTLADGRDVDADLVGSIPSNDVALVKVRSTKPLKAVQFGASGALRVGDPVVAIGNALGLGGTPSVTTGIVSALGRDLDASNGEHLSDLIQTDAAIYQGNSGGPLVDAEGEVVGVNTAVATSQANGAAENLGFALPIDQLKPLISKLKAGGGDVRGTAFLGVRTSDLENIQQAVRDRLGITTKSGAFVGEIVDGSAAQHAGLQAGDVITEIDGKKVESAADVGAMVGKLSPGDRIRITVQRDGKDKTLTATLGSRGTTR